MGIPCQTVIDQHMVLIIQRLQLKVNLLWSVNRICSLDKFFDFRNGQQKNTFVGSFTSATCLIGFMQLFSLSRSLILT